MFKKIIKKIIAHDNKFITENQNPVEMTRKMWRIAKRYNALRPQYDKLCQKAYDKRQKQYEKEYFKKTRPSIKHPNSHLTINKFFYLLKNQGSIAPDTIIGTHHNKNWEKQGMSNAWEFKNTGINRILNHQNFF